MIWYDYKLSSGMARKSFKTMGIILALDRSEVEILICYNPLLEDDQVMIEQDEEIIKQKLMKITISRRKRMKNIKRK